MIILKPALVKSYYSASDCSTHPRPCKCMYTPLTCSLLSGIIIRHGISLPGCLDGIIRPSPDSMTVRLGNTVSPFIHMSRNFSGPIRKYISKTTLSYILMPNIPPTTLVHRPASTLKRHSNFSWVEVSIVRSL